MSIENLAHDIQTSNGVLLVVTGAGISLASGIPTFRGSDPGAVWSASVTEMGTRSFFRQNPVESWRWYLGRFEGLEGKVFNAGHRAVAELERWKLARQELFLLVTQNIDGLHRDAGQERIVEVHGSARKVRCSKDGCVNGSPGGLLEPTQFDFAAFKSAPSKETLPRCPVCNSFLRPHVLWFDEYYSEHRSYEIKRATQACALAEVVIFVGTSFSVGITAMALQGAEQRGLSKVWNIDPSGVRPEPWVRVIPRPSEEALPELVDLLHRGA